MTREPKIKISLRSLIDVEIRKGLPRLIVHEQYETRVKWVIRTFMVLGVLISLIIITTWYVALSLALSIFLLQQFLEKAIFQYTSIYVQPMLETKYESAEWKAVAFAFPENPRETELNVVGLAFSSLEYARQFFRMISAWNHNQQDDIENNICLSFIVEDEKDYSTYLYPNPERKIIKETFKKIEEKRKYEKYGKQHQQLVTQVIFCKIFPYGPVSSLTKFATLQDPLRPYWLKPFLIKEGNKLEMLFDEPSILKHHFKFKKRSQLEEGEVEYRHGKTTMKEYLRCP